MKYTRFPLTEFALIVCVTATLISCGGNNEQPPVTINSDSARAAQARSHKADSTKRLFVPMQYKRLVISNASVLDSVRRTFAKSATTLLAYRAFTTLNRKDIFFTRVGDTLVVPDTIVEDLRRYSVFPYWYPAAADIPKIVLISNKWQCYACYEYGTLVRFAACNSGEERKPTLPGRYGVNWKSKLRLSSLDSTWRLPFTVNFHLQAGSAFHQFEMPGRPVSHSCVRQFLTDAEWLFKWVQVAKTDTNRQFIPYSGTPVLIIDIFDFSRPKGGPWLELTSNNTVELDLPAKPLEVEEALIPISQIPTDVRGGLKNKKRYLEADSVLKERGIIRSHIRLRESINYNKLRAERRKRAAKAKAATSE